MDLLMQNLKQALRDLRRHGWQAAVSAVGLAVGIVCLTFSLNWLWTETNYDYFRPGYKDVYQLTGEYSYEEIGRMDSLLKGQADVGFMHYWSRGLIVSDSLAEDVRGKVLSVSPGMVSVLGLKALSGNLEEALAVPGRVVLTESMARKVFGRTDVVGMSFSLQMKEVFFASQDIVMTVGAVVADHAGETNVEFDALVLAEYYPYNNVYKVFLRTGKPEAVIKTLGRIPIDEEKDVRRYRIVPLRMAHELLSGDSFLRAYFYPLAFTAISVLLWLSAMVNLLAVYTSVFLGRTREYALRRSLGASEGQNAGWMCTAVFPVLLVGLLLSGMAMEWTAWWGHVPGNPSHAKMVFAAVAVASCIVVGMGMAYPVWKVRRACRRMFEGRTDSGHSHAWLLVVQCLACAFLLFVSLGMQRQISGMMRSDLGFDSKDMLRLETGGRSDWNPDRHWDGDYDFSDIFFDLPQEFCKEQGAGITDAIAMRSDIFNRWTRLHVNVLTEDEWNAGKADWKMDENTMSYIEIPYKAFDFFRIRMAEGEAVEHDEGGDRLPVVLNEAARLQFHVRNLEEAHLHAGMAEDGKYTAIIGKPSCVAGKPLDVTGIADIHLVDFHEEEQPLMLVGRPERHGSYDGNCRDWMTEAIYVKHAPGRREDAEEAVRRVLRKFDVQDKQIHLTTLEDYIADNYKEEAYYANLLTTLTAFSLVVTLSGVFSMLLYALRLRRRSMAIRRVMGAEFRDIFLPQLRTYLLFVLAGCVLAYFPASLLMRRWMEYFHYGEAPGVGLMALIWAGMSAMVSLIVWWQVVRCMREKPVEVLAPES